VTIAIRQSLRPTRSMSTTLLAACLVMFMGGRALAEDVVEVKGVVGRSAHSFQEATRDAVRKAVEQGGGVYVTRATTVHNFELMSDTIYSRAAGYVKRYTIVKREEDEGLYQVTIDATVSTGKLKDDWGALNMLIQRVGWPNLLIIADEEVVSGNSSGNAAEYKLREIFEELGFDLIDDETIALIPGLSKTELHGLSSDEAIMRAAARAHADYALVAKVRLETGRPREVYGVVTTPVTATVDLKVVSAESPQQLASKSAIGKKSSRDATSAIREAIGEACKQIATEALDRMLYHWVRDLDEGARVVCIGDRIDTQVLNDVIDRLRSTARIRGANVVHHREGEMSIVKVISPLESMTLGKLLEELSGRRLTVTGYSGRRVDFAMNSKVAGGGRSTRNGVHSEFPNNGTAEDGGQASEPPGQPLLSPPVMVGAGAVILLAGLLGYGLARRRPAPKR